MLLVEGQLLDTIVLPEQTDVLLTPDLGEGMSDESRRRWSTLARRNHLMIALEEAAHGDLKYRYR